MFAIPRPMYHICLILDCSWSLIETDDDDDNYDDNDDDSRKV